jgi:hypothetical protein
MKELNEIEIQVRQHIHQIIELGTTAGAHQDTQTRKRATLFEDKYNLSGGEGHAVYRSTINKGTIQLFTAWGVYHKQHRNSSKH